MYGTFELLYELPMSAVSGGVGLGAGVGRGRGFVRGPLFAVTAPMVRMATENVAQINSVIVFIWGFIFFHCSSTEFTGLSFGISSGIGKKLVRREIVGGVQEARSLTDCHASGKY